MHWFRSPWLAIAPLAVTLGLLAGCSIFDSAATPPAVQKEPVDPRSLLPPSSVASVELFGLETASTNTGEDAAAAAKIDSLGAEAMAVLADASLSDDDRQSRFRRMLARELDVPLLARFTLGRHWRRASPEERNRYLAAFEDYVIGRYSRMLGGARQVSQFEVIGSQLIEGGDVLVRTRIQRASDRPVVADWRLRNRNGGLRVIDLMVEGLSLAQTQRQEFAAIMRSHNGRIDPLIAMMREKAN